MPANHDMTTLNADDNPERSSDELRVADPVLAGSVTVNRAVIRNPDLSQEARLTYVLLASYAGGRGSCFPGLETLAKNLGVRREAVTRYISQLVENGVVSREQRSTQKREPGQPTTNVYTLLDPQIHERKNAHGQERKNAHATSEKTLMGRSEKTLIEERIEKEVTNKGKKDEQPSPFVVELLEILGAEPTGAKQYQFISATDKQNRAAGLDSADVAREYAMWQEGETRKDYQHRNRVQGWANMCKRERGKPRRSNGSTPKPGTREYYEQPEVKAAMKKHEEEMHQWMKDRENERERCNQSELPLTTGSQSS